MSNIKNNIKNNIKRRFLLCFVILIFPIISAFDLHSSQNRKNFPHITVLSGIEISIPLIYMIKDYSKIGSYLISAEFNNDDAHIASIEKGIEADIFITASNETIDKLMGKGLIDIYSKRFLAIDYPVLIKKSAETSVGNNFKIKNLNDLKIFLLSKNHEDSFVMPNKDSAEYKKIHQLFHSRDIYENLNRDIIFVKNPADVVSMIAKHGGYGITMKSYATMIGGVDILYKFSDDEIAPTNYYSVVVASEHMDEARNFNNYLSSRTGSKTLSKYGFTLHKVANEP